MDSEWEKIATPINDEHALKLVSINEDRLSMVDKAKTQAEQEEAWAVWTAAYRIEKTRYLSVLGAAKAEYETRKQP